MKVVKFGGSSMADAGQYRKIRDILMADPERKVVVVSAAGKRFSEDHKLTDLLYLCHAHVEYGVDCSGIFDMIASRYLDIRDELGLDLRLEPELLELKRRLDAKSIGRDELVSRGEYFSAKLMAAYLGFQFVDAADWVKFNMDGTVNQEETYEALRYHVLEGDSRLLRLHARRNHPHLLPGRQRHHRRPGGGGSGCGRVRKLDGCVRHSHGGPPDCG